MASFNIYRFDIGEIVRQYGVPIEWDENAIQLEKKLAFHGSQLLLECLRDLKNSLAMAVPQPSNGITYGNQYLLCQNITNSCFFVFKLN